MLAAVKDRRHSAKGASALGVVLTAVISILSMGAVPAGATSIHGSALPPGFYVESGDARLGSSVYPFNSAGAAAARERVAGCSGAFCTIQINRHLGYPRYEVSELWGRGCVRWRLHQITGRFHTKNGGRYAAYLENSSRTTIAQYRPGRHDIQDWDPVYYIFTCN